MGRAPFERSWVWVREHHQGKEEKLPKVDRLAIIRAGVHHSSMPRAEIQRKIDGVLY
jgi:hypothetical protein